MNDKDEVMTPVLEEIGDVEEVAQGPGILLNDGPHLLRGFPN
ncbi:hypothetical protein [Amycolatopsis anabasis]|nr:hypothetical protein [Amycolatopsis anabasis]